MQVQKGSEVTGKRQEKEGRGEMEKRPQLSLQGESKPEEGDGYDVSLHVRGMEAQVEFYNRWNAGYDAKMVEMEYGAPKEIVRLCLKHLPRKDARIIDVVAGIYSAKLYPLLLVTSCVLRHRKIFNFLEDSSARWPNTQLCTGYKWEWAEYYIRMYESKN